MGQEESIWMKGNIVLAGFMGVGKGRTARAISARSLCMHLTVMILLRVMPIKKYAGFSRKIAKLDLENLNARLRCGYKKCKGFSHIYWWRVC
jgi:hypothetical protein